jgi:predicted RNA-binding protein
MREATVYLDQAGQRRKVLENVARVELTGDGVVLRKLFEPPVTIRAMIREVDFLKHSITLVTEGQNDEQID